MQNRPSRITVPTAAEMRLLQILWEHGEATVEEVVNAHPVKSRPNYKTTQTLLRIMEQKAFITHQSRGRVFVFKPIVSRKVIDDISVQTLLSRNFRGSAPSLLSNLMEATPFRKKDLDDLEAYIREYRKKHNLTGE